MMNLMQQVVSINWGVVMTWSNSASMVMNMLKIKMTRITRNVHRYLGNNLKQIQNWGKILRNEGLINNDSVNNDISMFNFQIHMLKWWWSVFCNDANHDHHDNHDHDHDDHHDATSGQWIGRKRALKTGVHKKNFVDPSSTRLTKYDLYIIGAMTLSVWNKKLTPHIHGIWSFSCFKSNYFRIF